MDRKRMMKLWADKELCECIRIHARKYFKNDQDREDACAEAWERIAFCPTRMSMGNIKKAGKKAMFAMYQRERRRRNREHKMQDVNLPA